jgi:hypothetical protein
MFSFNPGCDISFCYSGSVVVIPHSPSRKIWKGALIRAQPPACVGLLINNREHEGAYIFTFFCAIPFKQVCKVVLYYAIVNGDIYSFMLSGARI